MFITSTHWLLNVCELTSAHLQTDQRRLRNYHWWNDSLVKWLVTHKTHRLTHCSVHEIFYFATLSLSSLSYFSWIMWTAGSVLLIYHSTHWSIVELIYQLIVGQQTYGLLIQTWLMYQPTGSLQNRCIFCVVVSFNDLIISLNIKWDSLICKKTVAAIRGKLSITYHTLKHWNLHNFLPLT